MVYKKTVCSVKLVQMHTQSHTHIIHHNTHLSYQAYSHCRGYSDHRCMFSQHSGMCLARLCGCPGSSVSCCFNHLLRSLFWLGTRDVDNTHSHTYTHKDGFNCWDGCLGKGKTVTVAQYGVKEIDSTECDGC